MKLRSLGVVIALCVALPLGVADAAAKKKPVAKLSFDEAWAKCKIQVDKLAADHQAQRYSRGSSCMHTYGYRI